MYDRAGSLRKVIPQGGVRGVTLPSSLSNEIRDKLSCCGSLAVNRGNFGHIAFSKRIMVARADLVIFAVVILAPNLNLALLALLCSKVP